MIFNMVTGVEPKDLVRTASNNTLAYNEEVTGTYYATLYKTFTFNSPGVYYVFISGAYHYINDPDTTALPANGSMGVESATNVTYELFFNAGAYYRCFRVVVTTTGSIRIRVRMNKNGSLHIGYWFDWNVFGPASVTVTES